MQTISDRLWIWVGAIFAAVMLILAGASAHAQDMYSQAPASDVEQSADDPPLPRSIAVLGGDPTAIREALALEAGGDADGAIRRLQAEIQKTPEIARLWQVFGQIHWKHRGSDAAIAVWTRYRAAAGDHPDPHIWLGEAHAARNELSEALACYDRALELAPDDDETRLQRMRVFRWLGNVSDSAIAMRDLAARAGDRPEVRREYAAALFANREYAEAAEMWAKVRRDRPTDEDAEIREIASRAYATGDETAARDAMDYIIRHPGHMLALQVLTDLAQSGGRSAEALMYLQQWIDAEPDPARKSRLSFRASDLISTLHGENPSRYPMTFSVDMVKNYLDEHPHDVDVLLLLGEIHIENRDAASARAVFERALRDFNPQSIRASRGLFEVALMSGRSLDARPWLETIRAFNPLDPYLHYLEARMESAAGRYPQALEALDRLERAGATGAVAVLLFHGLGESDWTDIPSTRIVREQIETMKAAGFEFIDACNIIKVLESSIPPDDVSAHAPRRVASVTFDDARRDAMRYGDSLSRDLGVTFTMHVPIGFVQEDHPFIAGWNDLRRSQTEGLWHFGNHAYDGHRPIPATEGGVLVHPLANLVWIAELGRQETQEEYLARLGREYGGSRDLLVSELHRPREAAVFAYPFGDIGQLSHSNVSNAPALNLAVAGKYCKTAFIQSYFGYAVHGDNSLLYQRSEPKRGESGPQLLDRLLANHPVFLARAVRAEIAAQCSRPYLANEMIGLLERDGYPAARMAELRAKVDRMLGGSLFRWPFWRRTPRAAEKEAPEAPADAGAEPARPAEKEPEVDRSRRESDREPRPVDDLPPGYELRRETDRMF